MRHFLRQIRVVGGNCSSLAASTQVLARIETEGRCLPHRSGLFPAFVFAREILGAMGLARVFHDYEIVSVGQLQNRIHVGRLSVEMDRHYRRNRSTSPA